MIEKVTSISDLGTEYQLQLFNEIITDHKFGLSIIDIIDKQYFSNESFAKIAHLIKTYYEKHECLLNYPALRTEINLNIPVGAETFKTQLLDTIEHIEKCKINNLNVQETAKRFCKMQALKVAVNQIKGKLDKGILQDVDMVEEVLKKALSFRDTNDPITLDHDMDQVLSDDYRDVIPTGIVGIDAATKGGLAKGELALIIASLGTGKTTILSKIACEAYLSGRNVLQVYFEDKNMEVQRKHYSCISDIPLDELSKRKDEVKRRYKVITSKDGIGKLFLMKLPSGETTINDIKGIIKRLNSKGDKIEMLTLDYVDCVIPDKGYEGSDEWSGEGKVIRQLDTLVSDMDLACWAATQGGRSATDIEVIKTANMGGSLKKAQVGHLVISIGKTLEQREAGRATITFLKNRMGSDGMIFQNCLFDNKCMKIDTNDTISIQGFEDNDKAQREQRVRDTLAEVRANREKKQI